jgi:peptide/nickel transport system substrate-binding protein
MRPIVLLGGLAAALMCSNGMALAQKSGGVLKMYHRDNPPSASIHEEATNSTVVPFMSVFNNLVLYDQGKPQNSPQDMSPISPSRGAGATAARTSPSSCRKA